jgi:pilus assembly protein CpaB
MSVRSVMMIMLALLFGGSAAMGVNSLLSTPQVPKGDVVPVVVAGVDLPRGTSIKADVVTIKAFPKDMAPVGALSKVEDAVDRSVFIPLVKDDPLIESKLAPKGSGRGLSALIPKGMRAYSIKTPDVAQGVTGFILPGNRVDVLLSLGEIAGTNHDTGGGTTTTLLQNVEILAVDQKMDAPADNKVDTKELRTVTLLVTPQQANVLDLGQNKGILHLLLRNHEDQGATQTKPATLADLRFRQEKPWDERAIGVLNALGKALAQRPPAQAQSKPAGPAPVVSIRTIRGRYEGAVMFRGHSVSGTTNQRPAAAGADN